VTGDVAHIWCISAIVERSCVACCDMLASDSLRVGAVASPASLTSVACVATATG